MKGRIKFTIKRIINKGKFEGYELKIQPEIGLHIYRMNTIEDVYKLMNEYIDGKENYADM